MFQVRLHGRGGQGGVTAAELLAEAAFREGAPAPDGSVRRARPRRLHAGQLGPEAFTEVRYLAHERMQQALQVIPAVAGGLKVGAGHHQLPAVPRRVTTFDEVVSGLDESTALFEAQRCMSCGNCFGCDNCYGVCPDNAIIKLADGQYAIDYDYCKGCGLCAAECPCGAIEMEPGQA